ncbi:MAG TPA: DUF4363 family protein [Calditerricola sp.]|uniref:DUF4363 family protein n=1 Tax=Calditerricola satsumensis TaxID=373054 RepID=A0A8J3BAM6_9BACI|nr:DUF4363 family protein [Calditerricola satsumensis]GGK00037.1 hypothetical protein GCM10007043_12630 [Calditerricola satsumensis]
MRLRLLALALLGCLGLGLAAGCANPFKAPLSPEQDVLGAARATLRAVEEGQWATADEQYGRLVAAWRAIHRRVYLNADEGDIRAFEETLSELRAYLRHREQTDALATLYRLETLWHDIAKF